MRDELPPGKADFFRVALSLLKASHHYSGASDELLDQSLVMTACAELPEDLALIAWINPNNLKPQPAWN